MFDIKTLKNNQLTQVEQADLFEEITDEQMAQVVGGYDVFGGILSPTFDPTYNPTYNPTGTTGPIGSPTIVGPLLPPLISF